MTFQWQRDGVDIANGAGGASKGGGEVAGASGALTATALSATVTGEQTRLRLQASAGAARGRRHGHAGDAGRLEEATAGQACLLKAHDGGSLG